MSTYVDSRAVGDARVTVIWDATDEWAPQMQAPEAEWRRAMPGADAAGELLFDTNVVHVALGAASVLLDLGHGDAPERFMKELPLRRSPGVLAGLASIGVGPEQITHVVISHAHFDHFGGATTERAGRIEPSFPRARHFVGRAEWEGDLDRDGEGAALAHHLGALERHGLLELVDGDREIAPGVSMLHAPGESPGHAIVRVDAGTESFYYLGDLFHHTCEVEHLDWVPSGRDQAAMLASRERLIAEALPRRATLLFTHLDFPGWGRIARHDAGVRWERS
ncbi:MAG TPA: MBL fold metallo-hydrolase [Chloroflexota bacterium]